MTLKGYVCSGLSKPVLGTANCVSNSCENGVRFLFVFFCGSCNGSLLCCGGSQKKLNLLVVS